MGVLHQSLDLSNPDNVMLWAACCLGFFGFLRAGEFATDSSFDPSADIQVDSSSSGVGPLFIFQDGLSRALLSSFLQAILQAAGIPGKFSGHSFKIGAATTTAQRGVPDHLIKNMGPWSSDAYLLYVRTPVDTILSVAGRIS